MTPKTQRTYQNCAKTATFWVDVDGVKYPLYCGHGYPKIIKDTGEIVEAPSGVLITNYEALAMESYSRLKNEGNSVRIRIEVTQLASRCSTGYLGVAEVLQELIAIEEQESKKPNESK